MTAGPIRPLILLPSDPFGEQIGGIKSFVRGFVRFAPADFEPEFVACSSDTDARPLGRWQVLDMEGRPVRYLPVLATPDPHRRPRIPLSLKFLTAALIRRSAHRFKGRVLQFNHPLTPAGFLGVDAPKILVVHLNAADIDRGQGESRWGRVPGLLHRFEDLTLPRMDRIFLVNEQGLAFYRERHPDVMDRLAFLPTSVDQSAFAPLPADERQEARAALVDQLGVPSDPEDRVVLFVGRLEKQKDPVLLVEAFHRAQAVHGHLRLAVVGEGGLQVPAMERARALGVAERVHWLGFREHAALPGIMNGADVLLLASAFEGMPITVLEALACGLPVVAPAVGEIPRLVVDGRNGRLMAERTPDDLAAGMIWVVEQPREAFAEASRAAVAPFRPEQVLQPFYAAHRDLHEARARAATSS